MNPTNRHSERSAAAQTSTALVLAVVALAGMAYCHIKDVGMKFDEHVYYMAGLFCCNITASLALIPALIAAELRGSDRLRRALWAGAAGGGAAPPPPLFCWRAPPVPPRGPPTPGGGA